MNFRKIKGFISIIIVLSMLMTLVPTVFASDNYSKFTDFPTGWSKDAMEHAVDNGLLNGRTATTINPQDNLTRAEMATIINRVFGATIKADISKYTDVLPGDWYYNEIAKAVNMRTFVGNSGTTMNPEGNITREEVFTVIARALVLETEDYTSLDKYPDKDKVSDWAKSSAAILVAKGYVNGNDLGNLCPQCNVTREEFAQIMYNIIKTYYVKDGKFNNTGKDSSLIRTTGVTLENVTIDGDLVIGDGVGYGTVNLNNVTINGRLLCRGGEKAIKLKNTTVKEYVVVYDVNGTVHFDNYRTEKVFNGIRELTPATFKTRTGGGSGGSSGPSGPDDPVTPETYYKVYFHDGATDVDGYFDYAQVKEGTTLKDNNKKLDTIYESVDEKSNTYKRSSLGYNNLGTSYEHKVDADYLYLDNSGNWSVFTEDVKVDKDIHVYYANKEAVLELNIPQIKNLNIQPGVIYNSKSRFADSLKDALITTGSSLTQNAVKEKVDGKITAMYNKINTTTGLVDLNGNILEKDYGLKITKVISPSNIEKEINSHIRGIVYGDAPQIEHFIEGFLTDEFIVKMIESGSFDSQILAEIKKEPTKSKLLAYLDKQSVKDEIISNIKTNEDFKDLVSDDDYKEIITETVKDSQAFKDILTGDSDYKDEIIEEIKSDKLEDLVDILNKDVSFKQEIVKKVADPGKGYDDMSDLAKQTKDAIMNIINTDPQYEQYRSDLQIPDAYEAIVQYYVEGHNDDFPWIDFNEEKFEYEFIPMINDVIDDVIEKYFAYENDPTLQKPDGYDVMKDYFDSTVGDVIDDVLKDYANGVYDDADEGSTDANVRDFIDGQLPGYIEDALNDYINTPSVALFTMRSMDPNVEKAIDDALIEFVKKYVNGDTSLDDKIVEVIEQNIISLICDYFKGDSTIANDEDIKDLVDGMFNANKLASYIVTMTDPQKDKLQIKITEFLDSYKPYKDFMDALKKGDSDFEINSQNVHFATAIGEAVGEFTFAEILPFLKENGFTPIINILGEKYVEVKLFATATKQYSEKLVAVCDLVKADGVARKFNISSLTLPLNAPSVIDTIYSKYADNFKNTVINNDIYDYEKNASLQKLVNIDWFDLFVGYDPALVKPEEDMTGYYFKEYMDYYCAVLDVLIIFDDALCFYDTTSYTDEELIEVKKSLTKDLIKLLEELESIPEKIENGEAIAKGYTLNDLIAKVDSLKDVAGSLGTQSSAIEDVINKVKTILEGLGEGNLPNGYTLDDLAVLTAKLKNVVEGMNESRYEEINEQFNDVIKSALLRLDSILDELDKDGTIAGRPIDSIISKISILNTIYNNYMIQIKKVISALADADFGSLDINIDSEKYEDILFGREDGDIFNIDSIVELVKGRIGKSEASGYDKTNGWYIIDKYSKAIKGNTVSFQRRFY